MEDDELWKSINSLEGSLILDRLTKRDSFQECSRIFNVSSFRSSLVRQSDGDLVDRRQCFLLRGSCGLQLSFR